MKVTKGYLEETRELVVSLVEMAAEIRQLQEQAVSTPGQLFSDVRVQTTKKTDAMADRVVKYADLEELYVNLHRQYLDRFEVVTDAIRTIPVREQTGIFMAQSFITSGKKEISFMYIMS